MLSISNTPCYTTNTSSTALLITFCSLYSGSVMFITEGQRTISNFCQKQAIYVSNLSINFILN